MRREIEIASRGWVCMVMLVAGGCQTTSDRTAGTSVSAETVVIPTPPDNFSDLRKIINHPSDDQFPEVNHNGSLVAYSAKKNGNYDIFYFDPSKKRIIVTQASRHVSDDTSPAWGADGEELYFTSSRLKSDAVWKKRIRGGKGVRQITTREGVNDAQPHVSPDGSKIVFSSTKGSKSRRGRSPTLWIANTDGSMMTQIGSGYNPRWSPNGEKILFHAPADNNFDIWMINPDGTELTQLTTDSGDDMDACWSPDGSMVAFSSNREGSFKSVRNFDIWVFDLNGTGITQLTYDMGCDGGPDWSKNDCIYFHSNRDGNYDILAGTPVIPWQE